MECFPSSGQIKKNKASRTSNIPVLISTPEEDTVCSSKDIADLNVVLDKLAVEISSVMQPLETMLLQVQDGVLATDKGVSFLEVTVMFSTFSTTSHFFLVESFHLVNMWGLDDGRLVASPSVCFLTLMLVEKSTALEL